MVQVAKGPEGAGIHPSAEIEAVVLRWIEAHSCKKDGPLINMLSKSDHVRFLGSAPDEHWAGSLLRRGLAQHVSEVPDWTASGTSVEAFECGNVGWAIWRGQVNFAGREAIQDVRFSFVLTLDDGDWRLVQVHCSIAQPNEEFSGAIHNAFSDLIELAKLEHVSSFGEEGAAAIMFTDVANSTEIANAVGDRKWAVAIGKQLELQALVISNHEGKLVKTLGDGAMASFSSAGAAIRAAKEIQSTAYTNRTDPILKLRVGVHAGDVIRTKDDFFGTVVNKTARIAALAEPNEILVSDAARAMAGENEEFKFSDSVSVALRGIAGTHTIASPNWEV